METCGRGRNLCCTGPVYTYGHCSETYPYVTFCHKKLISILGFGDSVTRDSLRLICKFLHFVTSETTNSFEGQKKHFKIFPLNFAFKEQISGIVFAKSRHSD
jgi:hypothetical protein